MSASGDCVNVLINSGFVGSRAGSVGSCWKASHSGRCFFTGLIRGGKHGSQLIVRFRFSLLSTGMSTTGEARLVANTPLPTCIFGASWSVHQGKRKMLCISWYQALLSRIVLPRACLLHLSPQYLDCDKIVLSAAHSTQRLSSA